MSDRRRHTNSQHYPHHKEKSTPMSVLDGGIEDHINPFTSCALVVPHASHYYDGGGCGENHFLLGESGLGASDETRTTPRRIPKAHQPCHCDKTALDTILGYNFFIRLQI